ncbi:MAG: fumarylacetoacetate hydrolase family protein [Candidatus Omnitrophica bacterium]|nr:fumarylacetoacetate hydrolase family protein [Candidatus Omnitrophota bacterium]
MKILRFMTTGNRPMYGVWEEDAVRVIAGDPFGIWGISDTRFRLEQITLILPPVDPPNIVGVGINFEAGAEEFGVPIPEHPPIHWQSTTSLTGRDRPLIIPRGLKDSATYQVHLALAIRSQLYEASEAEAAKGILGYTGAITISFPTDPSEDGPAWTRGRSYDSTTSIGPFLQTKQERIDLNIRCRLNGTEVAFGKSSDFLFSCEKIVSEISHRHTLRPGTLILTGPIPGVETDNGKPSSQVHEGDILEVEVDGAGRLSNPVVAVDE